MAAQQEGHARGRMLVLAATCFWGTSATLARFVFRHRAIPPLTVVELRLVISATFLAVWMAWRRPQALVVRRGDWAGIVLLGLLGVAAIQGGYYYSISVLGVGLAILIQYLAPTLIVFYDVIRGARLTGRVLITLIAALSGTALLIGNVGSTLGHARPLDWMISFSTAFTFAFYIVYSKRVLERHAPETILLYTFLVAGVFWAVITPPWRIVAAHYDAQMWGLFFVLAVCSALIPFACFYAGLRRMPPAEAGILATLEPAVAVVSAWLFLGEGLVFYQWLGALLVLLAAALASYGSGTHFGDPAPPPDVRHEASSDTPVANGASGGARYVGSASMALARAGEVPVDLMQGAQPRLNPVQPDGTHGFH
jgi:drug/metabolite transporter (DMT)-like permease